MRRHGYTTGAVDHLFAMKDWFIRGYDDYMPPPGRSRSPGSVINEIGFPWIEDHADEDFFLFLHFWDAHIPYLPPSPFKERFTFGTAGRIDPLVTEKLEGRPSYPLFKQNLYDFLDSMPNLDYIADLYDAEVAYLDFEIGRLFNHLGEHGLLDDTVVVLFGDHGENMTEHDSWFDHAGLYDSVVHVPLILWAPGRVPVVDSPAMVTLVDVLPTVLEILGLPEADGIDGRSLMPLMRGEATVHRDVVMLSEATWQASRGVRTEEWKFIRYLQSTIYGRDGVELYHLADDPDEQHNVAELHPEVVENLDARLHHWVAAQLAGRPDPSLSVIDAGLPAVARLNEVIAGQARPRNDVPAPAVPGHDLVPVAAFGPTETDPLDADHGQRFAPFNPHRRRLRGARGVLVGAMVVAAALLLGVAVNDLLLSDPLSATGVVQPTTQAQLNMSATGPIASLPVHVGEMVHAGQVLATQDTTAITAKLSADQSKLAADQATLQQQQAGTQTVQLQQLKDQVSTAQVQQVTAQQKLNQTEVTTDASVAAAQEQVQADQTLLNADQQTYTDEEPQCLSAAPPAACASDQRQVQVDQGNLLSAQSGYNQSLAQQQAQIGAAQSGVTEATAAVSTAQAALAVGSAPATAQEIAGTEAAIQQDNANIATDKTHLAQAVLTAPFNGVVSAIDGSVGEVATSQGIRQATAPGSVSQPELDGDPDLPPGSPEPDQPGTDLRGPGLARVDADQAGGAGPRDRHPPDPHRSGGRGLVAGGQRLDHDRGGDPDPADTGHPVGADLLSGRPGGHREGGSLAPTKGQQRPPTRRHHPRSASPSTSPSETGGRVRGRASGADEGEGEVGKRAHGDELAEAAVAGCVDQGPVRGGLGVVVEDGLDPGEGGRQIGGQVGQVGGLVRGGPGLPDHHRLLVGEPVLVEG